MTVRSISTTAIGLLVTAILGTAVVAQDRLSGRGFASRSEVIARNGMVATSHPFATQIALDVLKEGGNAVDAAIAANAFLGLGDPGNSGIGGDLFAVVWDAKTKQLYGLNASGRSARAMTLAELKRRGLTQIPANGPLAVSVPGCVDGWFALHGRFGSKPMARLLAPTIAYARDGFPVAPDISDDSNLRLSQRLPATPPGSFVNLRSLYMSGGTFPKKGEIFQNPGLASTLEAIATRGRDEFYKGPIAAKIAAHIKAQGGFLSVEDFAAHTSDWVTPVSTMYRGYRIWELPPNTQGSAVLQMLNVLEGVDLSKAGFGSADHVHWFTEAKKLVFEDLANAYAEPQSMRVPVDQLLSKEYAATRRALVKPDRAGVYHSGFPVDSHTVYLTTADKDGNMVSLIQSNSLSFGSLEVVEGLGFALHNRGMWFELTEGHPNSYAPGKRPFHTIIPGFVTKDDQPFMSFGLMGGDMQPQGHVQILLNLFEFGMNLQEAGDAPRIYHVGSFPRTGHVNDVGELNLEAGYPAETIRESMRRGHKVGNAYGMYGGYQAIMRKDGVYYGASESRKDGYAAGY
ncbi:Putative gamma-glutamyltransferase YwrD [Luteitalea pratensis]|uniref:Glutathione hydrolase proenzyme n=1 Tax=Luteitalea pratensis TaxID=1855912 RepID=A0A143PGD5_LUTPR|nr:gamma-glutamyltransferase [Luteitalea pratensis]AMY07313.1 Putative gamma-glutamyltransferase YwrD [Luteitalea pratensis]